MKNKRRQRLWAGAFGPWVIPYLDKREKSRAVDFRHSDVDYLLKRVEHRELDFDAIEGDTIKSKYEGLYVAMLEVSNELFKLKLSNSIIITSPEISSIFETSCSGWYWWPPYELKKEVRRVTNLNNRWIVYQDAQIPANLLLATGKDLSTGIALKIVNFVI